MTGCPRRKDNVAALRQIRELIKGREKKVLEEDMVDRSLEFARNQVSMGMSHRWSELVSLGDNLARVSCGAIKVLVDGLEMVRPEAAWGKKGKAVVSGLAVGCSVLGRSGMFKKHGELM